MRLDGVLDARGAHPALMHINALRRRARDAGSMTATRALQAILAVAIAGAAFSGYLTWRELATAASGCEALGPQESILGYPPCVYGLAMYTLVIVLAAWGWRASRTAG